MFPQVVALLAAAGTASWLGYNCYAPASQLYGRTVFSGKDPRLISLTFDDGPNDPHTFHLLEVLAKYGVVATFFLIGKFVKAHPEIARAVVAAGHTVGNHTYNHPNLALCSKQRIERELSDCSLAIRDATGANVSLFRPPFGARRPAVLKTAQRLNYATVMWNVTCFDWQATTPETVEHRANKQIAHQAWHSKLVLLHDGGHQGFGADRSHTVIAAERLIARYKNEGYRFATVPEMMAQSLK